VNHTHPVGSRVEAGQAEDYATGVVLGHRYGALSGNWYVSIAWDSGEQTECLNYQLRAEGESKRIAAEREETLRHIRQTAGYQKYGSYGVFGGGK
jgi:hypothetical protein